MTISRLMLKFGLLAVLLTSACVPAATLPAPAPVTAIPTESSALAASTVTSLPVQTETTLAPTEIPPQSVATSRGPDLEATDPITVNLAAGQIQLVEFFRFT